MTTKAITGYRLKDGKLVKVHRFDASKRRRIITSKKVKVVSRQRHT